MSELLSRPTTKAGQLQRAVLDLLREHEAAGELPTSKLGRAVEVEALGQGVVTDLVRAALDALLPQPFGQVLEREQVERETWAATLGEAA